MLLLLVVAFTGKAQTILFSENFDAIGYLGMPDNWTSVDNDGDTYNWYCDTNSSRAYGGSGHFMTSASYVGQNPLTPNNWLITPAITLTGNSILNYYVGGQDPNYAQEHYAVMISTNSDPANLDSYVTLFEETLPANTTGSFQYLARTVMLLGYNGPVHIAFRHYNVTNMFRLNLDNISVTTLPTEPAIVCGDTLINFKNRSVGVDFPRHTFQFTAYNLSGNVTISVAAPFTVSTDSLTGYGSSVNITPTDGIIQNKTIYVKASSATAGNFSEYLTLTATGAETHSIHLKARVFNCDNPITLPFSEHFDSGVFPPSCWTLHSTATGSDPELGYEYTWMNAGSYAVCTGDQEQVQNEVLETPAIDLTDEEGSLLFSFYIRTRPDLLIADSMTMLIEAQMDNGAWTTIWDMLSIKEAYQAVWTSSWPVYQNTIDLTSYIGHTIKLRFRYIAELGYADQVWLTGINFNNFTDPYLAANADTLDFFAYLGEPTVQEVKVSAYNFTTPVTINTSGSFLVSTDGINYSQSDSLTNGYRHPLYVKYIPTEETIENSTIYLTSSTADTTLNDTIALNGISHDCSTTVLPIVEGFESITGTVADPNATEYCWHIIYENAADTNNFMINTTDAAFIGDQAFKFTSSFFNNGGVYGQYLISPELSSDETMLVTFNYEASSAAQPETFVVGYSTTTRDTSAFVWETPIVVAGTTDWGYYMNNNVPANTKYVAIKYLSSHKQHLYIDNFKIMANPTCLFPMGLKAINTNNNSAIFGWDSVNTANAWQIAFGTYPLNVETATPVDITSADYQYTLNGLTENTHYQLYMRTVCDTDAFSAWTDPIDFYTSFIPDTVPYTMGFETSETDVEHWTLQNADMPNRFMIGIGAHAQGSQRGLYISRDNSSNTYVWTVGSGENETNVSNYSTVWAYRDIYFTPTEEAGYLLSFNWRCYGEPDYDFGEVFIGNATAVTNFERDLDIPGAIDVNAVNYTPKGLTKLGRLSGMNTWATTSYLLDANEYSGTTKRIYFLWTNDSLSGNNNPIAIDNIKIEVPNFANITGTITDGTSGNPIANAYVKFTATNGLAYETISADDGTYSILNVVAGSYLYFASATGYITSTEQTWEIEAGANTVDIALSKEPCALVPTNMEYTIEDNNMILQWTEIISGALTYSRSGTLENALGLTDTYGYQLGAYHLYTPGDLESFNGGTITSISSWFSGDPTFVSYTLCIWVGGSGVASDGPASEQPVYQKELSAEDINTQAWVEYPIDPYVIDRSKCLWIGYEAVVSNPSGIWPCGFSDNDAGTTGFGDVLHFGSPWTEEWMTLDALSDGDMSGNWCIRANVQAPDITYAVYEDGELLEEDITEATYTVSPYVPGACYKVRTTCENGEVSIASDCATPVSIEDRDNTTTTFSVYPNPATDMVTVSSSMNADRAEILNYLGQVIYSQKVSNNVFTMNVASLADGVYFIRLIGNDGIATQKLIKK